MLEAVLAFVAGHPAFIGFAISECLALLPTRYKGIVQGVIEYVKTKK